MAQFDWYCASVPADPAVILQTLRGHHAFDCSDVEPAQPRQGYERAYRLQRGDSTLAQIQYGGQSVGPNVWVCGTGSRAPAVASFLRERFSEHLLIRADVCLDYVDDLAWQSLHDHALAVADAHRLRVAHHGDYHRGKHGRTLAIGSRTSAAYARVYEKGRKEGGRPDWVRVELELKPQNARARGVYASASPEQILQATRWSAAFFGPLLGPDAPVSPAPPGTVREQSSDDRALEFMARQYGNVLRRRLEALGGDLEAFAVSIAKLL